MSETTELPFHFADTLIERVRALGHPLCAGFDPHLPLIPPLFRQGSMERSDPRTAAAVRSFVSAALDRLAPQVAVIKPQIAFYEQLGWRGIQVLEELITTARKNGVLVLLDAKRGDIGSTAEGYAAYLDPDGAMPVDAMTVNPYLGRDTLQPYLDRSGRGARGVFVLAKTSNPGSADYQDRQIDGQPLYEVVAASLAELSVQQRGPRSGWSSLGIVAGATYPEQSERLRMLLPHALFLVPGYGAQGGSAADAVRSFVRSAAGHLEGGVVNSSRGLLSPAAAMTDDLRLWERRFDDNLRRTIDELGDAIR